MREAIEVQTTIVIDLESRKSGLWLATSRMIPNLAVFGNTREECFAKLPGRLADFAALCRERARQA